ncbi:signal recognition particle receptor beta subunit [Ostertagia ostertagi]
MEHMETVDPEVVVKPAFAEPNLLAIVVAALVVFLTVAFFFYRSLKSKADTFLLVGLSDSGKTHIFGKIANKSVDFPGAERLRKQLVEKWLKKERASLRGITFVVDSSSFSKRSRDVAEFLTMLLWKAERKPVEFVECCAVDGAAVGLEAIREWIKL